MQFRKFTLTRTGEPVWVDMTKIAYFRKSNTSDGTAIVFVGDADLSITIDDTVADVIASLGIEIEG